MRAPKGIDVERAIAHPIRSMMRLDLIASSVAISVFLLFYYASVSVLTIYWVVTYNRSTPQANGINVWYAAALSIGLVVAGALSDWAHVRKPFMLFGAVCAMVMMGFLILQTGHPHTGYYANVLVIVLLAVSIALAYAPWMANYTKQVESHDPALDGVGLTGMGLDPPYHGGAVVPGAALRDHDLHDTGGQPEHDGHSIAGDRGSQSPMHHRPRRLHPAPASSAGVGRRRAAGHGRDRARRRSPTIIEGMRSDPAAWLTP